MTYKPQQVLRTLQALKSQNGSPVPANSRVVVMRMVDGDKVRVKIVDPAHPALVKQRIVAATKYFNRTFRGRPKVATPLE